MYSFNFKNILRWKPPDFPRGNLTYRVQSKSFQAFEEKCVRTSLTECDFSNLSKYSEYTLRVRAEFAGEHSDWVNITFFPQAETIIGPPGMQVEALASSLHIRFIVPRVENEPESWTMKSFYHDWSYNLEYWRNGSDHRDLVNWAFDAEVLRGLEPFTTYCLRAQVFIPDWNRTGLWTTPACQRTKGSNKVPPWVIALVVVGASACGALLLLGCFALLWYVYRKTKHAFSPQNTLPQHLKEFLGFPPHSPLLLFTFSPSESEVFDKLSVVSDVPGDKHPVPADSPSPPLLPEEPTQAREHRDPPRSPTPEPGQTLMPAVTT